MYKLKDENVKNACQMLSTGTRLPATFEKLSFMHDFGPFLKKIMLFYATFCEFSDCFIMPYSVYHHICFGQLL